MKDIPPVGALLVDTASRAVGEFRDAMGGKIYLRPIGGGREWLASPENVRPATSADLEQCEVMRGGR